MTTRPVQQYLARHAEPEAADAPKGQWDTVVVVPAAGEDETLDTALDTITASSSATGRSVLAVVVINAREGAPERYHRANASALTRLRDRPDTHLIDRARLGRRFPDIQGVGLARKIGCDVALALWARGAVLSPWIRTTDADARVAADYLAPIACDDAARGVSVCHFPFDHRPMTHTDVPRSQDPLWLYDLGLRYYVAGLQWAGSPYAYHTVGSTLAIHAAAYAAVRGFPKRLAAEDFHLLNKLAKVGRVQPLDRGPITLIGRPSDRVPFGTGRGTAAIEADAALGKVYAFYDPRTFEGVARWLTGLDALASHRDLTRFLADLGEDALGMALRSAKLEHSKLPPALSASPSDSIVRQKLTEAFDALRTMKLIHHIRDQGFPSLAWHQAIENCAFFALPSPAA